MQHLGIAEGVQDAVSHGAMDLGFEGNLGW